MTTVNASIGYMSSEGVVVDTLRPGGLLRAPTRPVAEDIYQALSIHECAVQDLAASGTPLPALDTTGFDTVDLSGLTTLQTLLQEIRAANYMTDEQIRRIRRLLLGKAFRLSNGKTLRILFIAGEGTILRR